jgi:MSHA biogenesis protein MshN
LAISFAENDRDDFAGKVQMSVINKMLRDLNQRSALDARSEGFAARASLLQAQRVGSRWKTVAWILSLPIVAAGSWFAAGGSLTPWKREAPAQTSTRMIPKPVVRAPEPVDAPKSPVSETLALPVKQGEPVAMEPAQSVADAAETPTVRETAGSRVDGAANMRALSNAAQSATLAEKFDNTGKGVVVRAADVLALAPRQAEPVKMQTSAVATKSDISAPREAAEKTEAKPPAVVAEIKATTAPRQTRARAQSLDATTDLTAGKISIQRQERDSSRAERAASDYRAAGDLLNQGQIDAAIEGYISTLRFDPGHSSARQTLVTLLLRRGRIEDSQTVLRDGLKVAPTNAQWAMLLARLQVEAGDHAGATETLDTAMPYAKDRPDFHAFAGTVLQLQGRHKEAIGHYEISVRLVPNSGPWLTGLAVSLEDEKRLPEAREAYQRALSTSSLVSEQRTFVERKLEQLK